MNKIIEIRNEELEKPKQSEDLYMVRQNLYKGKELVTIMILAYEKVEKTCRCVESVLKYTQGIPYKLILVDNGSPNDNLLQYFQTVHFNNKQIVHIHKNINGIYAIDQVISLINTEYFVLINNDVIVTKNWLKNMLICAESDKNIGMICPVSTNITWEQEESLGGFSDYDEMQLKAAAFNVSNPDLWEERIRLIPILGLLRSEVFDIVGKFDMGYMHDFGDDDHSFRIRRGGYKLILCRDVFVHHDHPRTQELIKQRQVETNISRKAFSKKFYGIDAWDDTQNVISPYLKSIDIPSDDVIKILAVESKCGAPALDIKNICIQNGKKEIKISTVTENPVYYQDLESISTDVISGDIRTALYRKEDEKFHFIYIGKEINLYSQSLDVLRRALRKVEKMDI